MNTIIINKRKGRFTSFLITLAFLFNSICLLANILFPDVTGFGDVFVVIILALGILSMLFTGVRLRIDLLCVNLVILAAIILSYMFYDGAEEVWLLLINFVVWGIGVTVIMMQKFDVRDVMNYSFWLGTVIIIADLVTNAHENYDAMVWTYAVFPCLAATTIHFVYCRFQKRALWFAYIPGLLMLSKMIAHANRGGLLSVLVLLFFVSVKAVEKSGSRLRTKRLVALVTLVLSIIFVLFFDQLIESLYKMLMSFGYEVEAVTKMYRLVLIDNLTNNRDQLYEYAWKGFLASPLWGNGVGGFSVNYGGWAHNFILQLLYEGGLLLSSLVLIPLVRDCVFILKEKRLAPAEYAMFILLFSASIPRLLVSTELWNTQIFWMLFAFGFLMRRKYKYNQGDVIA